jgi:hypothetical protein
MAEDDDFGPEAGGRQSGRQRPQWFGPKRFGWGYSPRTWQGWLVTIVVVVVIAVVAIATKGRSVLLPIVVAASLIGLGAIVWVQQR